MEEVIYLDRFTKEYVNIKENFTPPERYLKIYKSLGEYYIEVWSVIFYRDIKLTKRLIISYDELDRKNAKIIREQRAKDEGVILERQLIWYVPDSFYQKILSYL